MNGPSRRIRPGERGAALVLTLVVLTLITAMVVEFAYGVYVNTSFLGNWQKSQKLSITAGSGASLAAWLIKEATRESYTYPGSVYLPPADPFSYTGSAEGADTLVSLRITDENAKFNLNTLVLSNNELNTDAYEGLRRMLAELDLEEEIADRIADWIDQDEIPRIEGSELGAKNAPLDSVDEILLTEGMSRQVYDKLSPYVTVHGGVLGLGLININSAEVPVLMTLSESVTGEMAERVVSYRENKPFRDRADIQKVAGFETLGPMLGGKITVKGSAFRAVVTASSEDGITRVVDCVLDPGGSILYWKEY